MFAKNGFWRCPLAVFFLEASAEAGGVFEEFLHLVGEKTLGFHHRHRLELLVGERKALEKVVRGELALLDEIAVVKVQGFVELDLEEVGLAEHLEGELKAVLGDLVGLRAEHDLKPAEAAVANGHDHLLHHFIDFFIRFHFKPRLFVVYVYNIHTLHTKHKYNFVKNLFTKQAGKKSHFLGCDQKMTMVCASL